MFATTSIYKPNKQCALVPTSRINDVHWSRQSTIKPGVKLVPPTSYVVLTVGAEVDYKLERVGVKIIIVCLWLKSSLHLAHQF